MTIIVNGGFLKLEEALENGTLNYSGCVIQTGSIEPANASLFLEQDNAVFIIDNPGEAVLEDMYTSGTKPAVFDETDASGRAVMCHTLIDVSTSPNVTTETSGGYYKGDTQMFFIGGLSGTNYVETSSIVSVMNGFSRDSSTFVSASADTVVRSRATPHN